VKDW